MHSFPQLPALSLSRESGSLDTYPVVGPNEELARRAYEVINRSESVDAVMGGLEVLMDPEVEFVNPADAIEGGTRKGLAGMRTVFENFFAGAGNRATIEVEQVHQRGERVFVRVRIHAKGASSGAEAVGPPVGIIHTLRDGLLIRMEWHYDLDEALAEFERGG
jgi:ketosteroid isomerase-like protein